jgi:hypothetical protein
VAKINYNDKQIATDPEQPIDPIEIFSAYDANQIKSVVNTNADLLTVLSGTTIAQLNTLSGSTTLNTVQLATLSGSTISNSTLLGTHTEQITSLSGSTIANSNQIEVLSGKTDTLNAQVFSLSGSTLANFTQIATNTGLITSLSGSTTWNTTQLATLSGYTTANTNQIVVISGRTDLIDSKLNSLSGSTTLNTIQIDVLSGRTDFLDGKVSGIDLKVNNLDAKVNTIETSLDNKASIANLSNEITRATTAEDLLQTNINKSQVKISVTMTASVGGQSVFTFSELIGQFPKLVIRGKNTNYTINKDNPTVANEINGYIGFNIATGAITMPDSLLEGETVKVEYTATGDGAIVPDTIALRSDLESKADVVNFDGKVVRTKEIETYTVTLPEGQSSTGFYRYDNGNFSGPARRSRMFPVTLGKNYKMTGLVLGNTTALAVYYSGTPSNLPTKDGLTYLGYEFRGPTSGTTQYSRQTLTLPSGTTYIGSSAVNNTPFPVLEDLVISYPGTVYETDLIKGKILRTPLVPSYIIQSPIQEFNNGYYRPAAITPIPNTGGGGRNSRLFTVDESKNYVMTGTLQGTTTALAVYYDAGMVYLGFEYLGGAALTPYTRAVLTLPASTKFIGTSTAKSKPFAELEEVVMIYRNDTAFRGNSNKTIEDLDLQKASEIDDANKKIIRNSLIKRYTNIASNYSAVNGFFHFLTGLWSTSAARSVKMFPVSDDKTYVMTGVVQGNVTALAIYYSGTPTDLPNLTGLTRIGWEFRGPDTGTNTYNKQLLNIPQGTTYVASDSTLGSLPSPILEEVDEIYREDIAYTGGSTKTIADLEEDIASSVISPINFGCAGDSMTARPIRWPLVTAPLLNAVTVHNVAVASARWSKTTQFSSSFPVLPTQNWDDPNFKGISTASPDISLSNDEIQAIANNCAVVHIQKFIAEVTAGNYPAPDVFVFAYGTNTEYSGNGNFTTAMAGKTISRDDTFSMANAIRWCIQAIMDAYSNCKIFVRTIVQRGNQSHNETFSEPKNALIRQIANKMSVPVIDMYNECGISEKFEVFEGAGRYLTDGIHQNEAGALLDGTFTANAIRAYRLIM